MRTIAGALAGSILFAAAGGAAPLPMSELESQPTQIPSRDIFAETELYCLTLGLYFEGGSTGEPEVGLRHIARVVTERAKADRPYWGGKTICGVVFYKRKNCQFSFACLPLARRTPKGGVRWEISKMIAIDEFEGRNEEPDPLIRYYMNPQLSALKNVCAFRKEFVPVVKAGQHEFFREATTWERTELASSNPEACQRYAESLKAKHKAKKGKKKSRHARGPSRKKALYRTATR